MVNETLQQRIALQMMKKEISKYAFTVIHSFVDVFLPASMYVDNCVDSCYSTSLFHWRAADSHGSVVSINSSQQTNNSVLHYVLYSSS